MVYKKLLDPIHPGEILLEEFMKPMGISINRLARDVAVPPGRISSIVNGKRAITADTALRLGKYFGDLGRALARTSGRLRSENRQTHNRRTDRQASPRSRGLMAPLDPNTRHRLGRLATNRCSGYASAIMTHPPALSLDELRGRLRLFCEKHHIRRLELFGSAARGATNPSSDVDLLVTFDESAPVSTAELLEMAGEAEELVGRPVDFVLRPSLEKSRNRYAREHILATAVCLYGN